MVRSPGVLVQGRGINPLLGRNKGDIDGAVSSAVGTLHIDNRALKNPSTMVTVIGKVVSDPRDGKSGDKYVVNKEAAGYVVADPQSNSTVGSSEFQRDIVSHGSLVSLASHSRMILGEIMAMEVEAYIGQRRTKWKRFARGDLQLRVRLNEKGVGSKWTNVDFGSVDEGEVKKNKRNPDLKNTDLQSLRPTL
ncbi:hypothetical protein ACOSQ4_014498 [Xanthoceras sorbifolium]